MTGIQVRWQEVGSGVYHNAFVAEHGFIGGRTGPQ
jgi:hypothetical protein